MALTNRTQSLTDSTPSESTQRFYRLRLIP
jgi:hypothetical protein